MQFNIWDAYVDAQTISTNLDLNGKFETGPFNHAVLIGTDYWFLDKNIEAFFCPNPTVGPINIYAPVYAFPAEPQQTAKHTGLTRSHVSKELPGV